MPYVKIQVNRKLEAEQSRELLKHVSQRVAKELSKPESYVMVEVTDNTAMLFGGNDAPAAMVELKSIGLPSVLNRPLSKMLSGVLNERLGIEPSRVYVEFTDVTGSSWGWNGATF
ncbi:phenylpyruvate tautomerase MIF-related protein [Methyloterricola oryzae]|uniref:phenylpyruvate tautomerase MIF-related protein n=1 Tax=Methyloterricola oryzae TaxID=1495050 RepID=UPI0005EB5A3C|nr:phenylpyruvate tautomerase MIF-related protein [Methyloterricola oryzae]